MENDTIQHELPVKKFLSGISIRTAIIVAVIIVILALAYIYRRVFIAATVDGSPITRLEVVHALERKSGKALLDSLISQKLIQNEASAKKIVVSGTEIDGVLKNINDQVRSQGNTIEAALSAQGMTMDDLKKQIMFQKEIEGLLGDKISVTDAEVAQYIKDNKITVPKGEEAVTAAQIKNELKNQKMNAEAPNFIAGLKAKAHIQYFVNY